MWRCDSIALALISDLRLELVVLVLRRRSMGMGLIAVKVVAVKQPARGQRASRGPAWCVSMAAWSKRCDGVLKYTSE